CLEGVCCLCSTSFPGAHPSRRPEEQGSPQPDTTSRPPSIYIPPAASASLRPNMTVFRAGHRISPSMPLPVNGDRTGLKPCILAYHTGIETDETGWLAGWLAEGVCKAVGCDRLLAHDHSKPLLTISAVISITYSLVLPTSPPASSLTCPHSTRRVVALFASLSKQLLHGTELLPLQPAFSTLLPPALPTINTITH
ncbi:unnamed protein product, partial [Protopolystoma xenopodis]